MPPDAKLFTVTWKSSKDNSVGKVQVDDMVLPRQGWPVYGFTEDQCNRLKESFKGIHTFEVEEGDKRTHNDDGTPIEGSKEPDEGTGAGGQSRTPRGTGTPKPAAGA